MKILVTGGAGFIGSHIADKYVDLGHRVIIIDNLFTGREEFISPKAKFYKMDIRDPQVKDIFESEKPDIVNHHAAQMNVTKSIENPAFDADVNIIGSLNIIENCVEYKVKKIIFASTGGAIYGAPAYLPARESHITVPSSPYGVSKLCVEKYLAAINAYSSLDYTNFRYANVYGPRQNPLGEAGVCAIFINKMLKHEACILYGFGKPVRDYVYVDDIVSANVIALSKGSKGTYNFGTGIGAKVSEIYEEIKNILGCTAESELVPLRKGELQEIYLDSSLAKKELDWNPKISMDKGLKKTVEYFKRNPKL